MEGGCPVGERLDRRMGGQGLAESTGGKREKICSFVLFDLASGVQAMSRTGQVGREAGRDGAGAR